MREHQLVSHHVKFELVYISSLRKSIACTEQVSYQPRSQGLSSLPPLVVGRETLVAAGHVTTQNLGGQRICWLGGVAECFVWLM